MSPWRPRAVLFDLDGTLIDSAPDLGAAADKMRTDRGLASLPLADYRPMAGAGQRCGIRGVSINKTQLFENGWSICAGIVAHK